MTPHGTKVRDRLARAIWQLLIEDALERDGQTGMPAFNTFADGEQEPCGWDDQSDELREWAARRAQRLIELAGLGITPLAPDPDAWCVELLDPDKPWQQDLARQGGRPPYRNYYIHPENAAEAAYDRLVQDVFRPVLRPVHLGPPVPFSDFIRVEESADV